MQIKVEHARYKRDILRYLGIWRDEYVFYFIGRFQLKFIFYEKTKSRGHNNLLCPLRHLKYREYCFASRGRF